MEIPYLPSALLSRLHIKKATEAQRIKREFLGELGAF
jgi:hypothetical protein